MAKKKPTKKAAAAKKKPTKRTSTAKKTARKAAAKSPRKAAAKKSAGKAAAKTPARKAAGKAAAKKSAAKPARKAAPRKAATKSTRKPGGTQARKAAPQAREPQAREQSEQTVAQAIRSLRTASPESAEPLRPSIEVVETTSAGTQPLAPEHAAVDELTSSGNELLDIFQKYDRHRTGYIDASGFARLLEALGQNITDEELQIAFDIVDTERAGKISWKQFKNWWTSR